MKSYKFFQNKDCEYFPCHGSCTEEFNCMFCYCPLYALGDKCGGNFHYLECGTKSCENCLIPHTKSGFDFIQSRINDVIEISGK